MEKQPRGGAGNDLILFIFFLIVLGIAWAVSGGPERLSSTSGPFFSSPFGNNGNSIPTVPIPDDGNNNGSGGESDGADTSGLLSTERLSPYASLVQLTSGRVRASGVDEEYVRIQASGTFTNPVPVASWRIESSETGQGTTLGSVALLPYSSQANQESPLTLQPNATLYVITGRSPIGSSFRTNLCTGYFAQSRTFEPSLRNECPQPNDELTDAEFSPNAQCIDFVDGLRRCEHPNTVPDSVGGECRAFIDTAITYNGCVDAHRSESDFFRNEWRVYLNRTSELWNNSTDRLRLLDENGFLVDFVSY